MDRRVVAAAAVGAAGVIATERLRARPALAAAAAAGLAVAGIYAAYEPNFVLVLAVGVAVVAFAA
jgi:hypothetical protein